jgi:hypothetical protein
MRRARMPWVTVAFQWGVTVAFQWGVTVAFQWGVTVAFFLLHQSLCCFFFGSALF